MPRPQDSRNDRQAVLAEVNSLFDEYLGARSEFERDLQVILEGHQRSKAVKALRDAFNARRLAFGRYVAAAAKAAKD
jgi:hypothetical protein